MSYYYVPNIIAKNIIYYFPYFYTVFLVSTRYPIIEEQTYIN